MSNIYKGVSFPFRFNSRGGVETSVLSPTDYSRIRESIQSIISTRVGERYMLPEYGNSVHEYLFENLDDVSLQAELADGIRDALERNDERILIEAIDFRDTDDGTVYIDVTVRIIRLQVNQTITVTFDREEG